MQIRAAELTADNLNRTVRIDHEDETFAVGRLVKIRHKRLGDAAGPDIVTQLVIEVLGDQRIAKRFDAIGVVDLL
jgi:hypothetical protein